MGYCANCDVVFQVPQPGPSELQEIYDRSYFNAWGEDVSPAEYWQMKLALARHILARVGDGLIGRKALDIGCATGAGLTALAEYGMEPHGIEVNAYAVEAARKRVPGAQVVHGALDDAPFADGVFSLVVLSDVIEHFPDPWPCMARISRLLAPGARLAVVTPDVSAPSARLFGRSWPHFKREHLVMFTRGSLRRLLEDAGLTVKSVGSLAKPLTLAYAERVLAAYGNVFLSGGARLLGRVLPTRLRHAILPVPMGEILAIAEKPLTPE